MATKKRNLTPGELWLLELERERYDTTWAAKPTQTFQPQIVFVPERQNAKKQRERDQIMFHAGRYAAGARDTEATSANAKVAALIEGRK